MCDIEREKERESVARNAGMIFQCSELFLLGYIHLYAYIILQALKKSDKLPEFYKEIPIRRFKLAKRNRNSHVSGTIYVGIDVRTWYVKDITFDRMKNFLYPVISARTIDQLDLPVENGALHSRTTRLTSFVDYQFEALDFYDKSSNTLNHGERNENGVSIQRSPNHHGHDHRFKFLMVG